MVRTRPTPSGAGGGEVVSAVDVLEIGIAGDGFTTKRAAVAVVADVACSEAVGEVGDGDGDGVDGDDSLAGGRIGQTHVIVAGRRMIRPVGVRRASGSCAVTLKSTLTVWAKPCPSTDRM